MTAYCFRDKSTSEIQEAFEDWKKAQISNGDFVAEINCNYEFVSQLNDDGLILGFPENIKFEYAFLNKDDVIDGLVIFSPTQCDGGNMTLWMQYQIAFISKAGKSEYDVIENYFSKFYDSNNDGFYFLDSLQGEGAYGTYYEIGDGGWCCPEIQEPFVIDLETNNLEMRKIQTKNKRK